MQISRGKLDRLHRTPAESTAWVCGGYGTSRTRARSSNPDCLIFGSCPSGRGFASALPSDGTSRSPPLRLASPLSPPDLGRGLAPPSCQACPAHTAPWTHRTRPPRRGKRCAFSTSFHRAFHIRSPTTNPGRAPSLIGKVLATRNPRNCSGGRLPSRSRSAQQPDRLRVSRSGGVASVLDPPSAATPRHFSRSIQPRHGTTATWH